MIIPKEYTVLFNSMSDTIEKLECLTSDGQHCLQLLKNAQSAAEEIYISEESGIYAEHNDEDGTARTITVGIDECVKKDAEILFG